MAFALFHFAALVDVLMAQSTVETHTVPLGGCQTDVNTGFDPAVCDNIRLSLLVRTNTRTPQSSSKIPS